MTNPRRPLAQLLIESVFDSSSAVLPPRVLEHSVEEVLEAGGLHRITPAVIRRLRAAEGVPAHWVEQLSAFRERQILRHLLNLTDLRAATGALRTADIPWVVAKGPVASEVLWPSPDMREYYDLDVFVHGSRFPAALATLEDAGFTLADHNWALIRKTMRAEVALIGPAGTHLDLHWDIAVPKQLRRAYRTDPAGMLERRVEVQFSSGDVVPTFDAVDTVHHLAFHAAQAGANRLMWLGDLHFATHRLGFDPVELRRRCLAARTAVPVVLVLERVSRVSGAPMPPGLSARRGRVWSHLAARRDHRYEFPGLPHDRSIGGGLYASARGSLAGSGVELARQMVMARVHEARVRRHGSQPRALSADIGGERGRRDYLAAVTEVAGGSRATRRG
ncbi:nucleotidyltransferase family protein [Pseudactinotalea sp. Z1732]|uniref:nucleotidyltransferase family protein n=1 Tax=Pseudactinotalea sp. Z1732 TaxID=3413026 RepID=UPI003C7CC4A9